MMLRHTLATLAYRAGKVLRDAPAEFQTFRPSEGGRSAGEILAHLGDLMDWAGVARFDGCLAGPLAGKAPVEPLFQGPVADAVSHVGQLAMMRRMPGAPIRGEHYFKADIAEGRVGMDQATPKREFS